MRHHVVAPMTDPPATSARRHHHCRHCQSWQSDRCQLAVWAYLGTCALSNPPSGAGGSVKQKAAVAGVLAILGTGSVLSGAASLENVLNAGIAAVCYSAAGRVSLCYNRILGGAGHMTAGASACADL
jgi:hypothetical protein